VAALNVSAVVLASRDSVKLMSSLPIAMSISDFGGAPVVGLMESQVQIAFADGDRVQFPLFYTEVQATDDNGPMFDDNLLPIMVRVPGPARPLGLPGFYLIIATLPSAWTTSFTVEVAISMNGDCGQAFASFTEETHDFRLVAGDYVRTSAEALSKVISAYSDTGISALALENDLSSVADSVFRIAHHLNVPGF